MQTAPPFCVPLVTINALVWKQHLLFLVITQAKLVLRSFCKMMLSIEHSCAPIAVYMSCDVRGPYCCCKRHERALSTCRPDAIPLPVDERLKAHPILNRSSHAAKLKINNIWWLPACPAVQPVMTGRNDAFTKCTPRDAHAITLCGPARA